MLNDNIFITLLTVTITMIEPPPPAPRRIRIMSAYDFLLGVLNHTQKCRDRALGLLRVSHGWT